MYVVEPTAHLDLHKIARRTMMRLQPARIEPGSMWLWTIASFCRQKYPRRRSLSRLQLNRGLESKVRDGSLRALHLVRRRTAPALATAGTLLRDRNEQRLDGLLPTFSC